MLSNHAREAAMSMTEESTLGLATDGATPKAQLHDELLAHDMDALWTRFAAPPSAPAPSAVPFLWPFSDVDRLMTRAGESVSMEDAERRVVMLVNPGLRHRGATSATLQCNFQLVLPGETARAHRHTMSAIRFVVSGSGACTTVEGEQVTMRPGDLILTPSWTWHDHVNDGGEPMLWLDGLDRPLVSTLEQEVLEPYHQAQQDVTSGVDRTSRVLATSRLTPVDGSVGLAAHGSTPVACYPWSHTEPALATAAAEGVVTPHDDVLLEYTNPATGGPVTKTIACFAQWLRPGVATDAHRQTSTTVYHVVRGSGRTTVDGVDLAWQRGDTFVVPSWARHQHHNGSTTGEAVLFSYSDEPALRALGLYREQNDD
jgi:gentisate 1,2-dioxygenase